MAEPFSKIPQLKADKRTDAERRKAMALAELEGMKSRDGSYDKVSIVDGKRTSESPTNIFDQASAGVLRPFEKLARGSDAPSLMNAYNIPSKELTWPQYISSGIGQGVGYALESAPIVKGVRALGAGRAVTQKLAEKEIAKTVSGDLAAGTLKNRLASYSGKKMIGNMVDNGITGAIQAGVESRGDPKTIAMGAGLGIASEPFGKYVAKPVFKKLGEGFQKVAGVFKKNVQENVQEAVQALPEPQVQQAVKDPEQVGELLGRSVKETSEDISTKALPQIKKDNILQPVGKERQFIETVRNSPNTDPELAKRVQGRYTPITNKDTLEAANKAISENEDDVLSEVLSSSKATADKVAKAQVLARKYSNEGKHELATRVVENLAKELTEQGQAVQAASMWNILTPEGIIKKASQTFRQANELNPKLNLKMTPELSEKLAGMVNDISKLPEGEEKFRATQLMLKEIKDQIPERVGKKIATYQIIAQLFNLKTTARNIVGNTIFSGLENANQALVATPIDKAVSLVTGKRAVTTPSLKKQIQGGIYGLKQGYKDVVQGIDTSGGMIGSIGEPPTQVFKKGPLKYAEKGLNLALRVPDRAFSEAWKLDYLDQAERLAKINKVPFDLTKALQEADEVAKYRTFQNESIPAKMLSGIKKTLNYASPFTRIENGELTPGDIGVGSLVLNYPKTPGNLLAVSGDYSPVGSLKTLNQIKNASMSNGTFDQKKFVMSLSRAITGTTGIGIAATLGKLGLIRGDSDDDKDLRAFNQQEGLGPYRLNVTGLKRFLESGFDPEAAKVQKGDNFVSYDWAQPMAINASIGANIAQGKGQTSTDKVGKVIDAIKGGVETFAETPVLSGLSKALNARSAAETGEEILKGSISSFVPTLLSQINQYRDNKQRDTYSPNFFKLSLNLAKSKIPGLAQTLPEKSGGWGATLERYKDQTNSFWNVFLNPAFVSKYNPSEESNLVLDLYRETGAKSHVPHIIPKKIRMFNQTLTPDAETLNKIQKYLGVRTNEVYHNLMRDKQFVEAPAVEQQKVLADEIINLDREAKLEFLGDEFLKNVSPENEVGRYKIQQEIDKIKDRRYAQKVYESLNTMTPQELTELQKRVEDNPEIAQIIEDLEAEDTWKKIDSLPPEQLKKAMANIPAEAVDRAIEFRQKQVNKFKGNGLQGLKATTAARMIVEHLDGLQAPEDIEAYLKNLEAQGFLTKGVEKEISRLLELKSKRKNQKTSYNMIQGGYRLPERMAA